MYMYASASFPFIDGRTIIITSVLFKSDCFKKGH